MEAETPPPDVAPPRHKTNTDLYGEPHAEQQCNEDYYEVYSDNTGRDLLFVAKSTWNGDEWIQRGLDRLEPKTLFHEDKWPVD